MKILILEDMEKYSISMKNILEMNGHEVEVIERFDSGIDACIDSIKSANADVILLDHDLRANFNGADIVARIGNEKVVSISLDRRPYSKRRCNLKDFLLRPTNDLVNAFLEQIGCTPSE